MSPTMVRQGGRVQLEPSDILLALNITIMAEGGFSRDTIEETTLLIKIPGAQVQDKKKQQV